jgi:hypothetical protein
MALNGLAGAGQAKTAILEAKGIYAPASKASIQMFGGIFGKSNKSNTSTPTSRKVDTHSGGQENEHTGKSGEAGAGDPGIQARCEHFL